ncbi:uncharacterized protein KQ657_004473 [Scheffersomyces spartinae]|uniref:PX domain-containing protein n=1 Tax=Scheffersomyces spartinae TaxID=45513 RepID=A0A9P8AK53_9ASCO|nr:uncharacterized protein KQ657_004473 [Scheffersomyces spartinae]KAG7194792.1 hypothetical protein KQ657_004473 [Scheffersomyces spartinae]
MNTSVFEDIEQDNNPSFYGNLSILNNPYGTQQGNEVSNPGSPQKGHLQRDSFEQVNADDFVNNSIVLSNKITNLINDPKVEILIVSTEKLIKTSIVVYAIELTNSESSIIVKRRYSEFKSLRDNLCKLYPTIVIPPIPEKHSLFTYIYNSIDNSLELSLIEMRRRYFITFLTELIRNTTIRSCPLLLKFLDPNYELCWMNALNEPPVILLPNNLLLANPLNPSDQNGLYSLLPVISGFNANSGKDSLPNLTHLSNEFANLKIPIDIPDKLIQMEVDYHRIHKILNDMNKIDTRLLKNIKGIIDILIELGGNLNNFSLTIYDSASEDLSLQIEKFGSNMDKCFLSYETFLNQSAIPNWQEPIHSLIQYYMASLQILKFYKYKLVQLKILHKLRLKKSNQLLQYNNLSNLSNLSQLEINSPTISMAIKSRQTPGPNAPIVSSSSKWKSLFNNNHISKPPSGSLDDTHFFNNIEKELNKLDQLIGLCNSDIQALSKELQVSFDVFNKEMERKWTIIMLDFIRDSKKLFTENLNSWSEFKDSLT